jgi:hypothetical protein
MKTRLLAGVFLIIIIGIASLFAYHFLQKPVSLQNPPASNASVENTKKSDANPYHNEQSWVAYSIIKSVADTIGYVTSLNSHNPYHETTVSVSNPQPNALKIILQTQSSVQPKTFDLTIEECVWTPSLYDSIAKDLLASLNLPAEDRKRPVLDGNPLKTLIDLRAENIEKENQRLSEFLTKEPLDYTAHEQAAFVWGAMALREASGNFYDARPALNGLSAHLILARALRGNNAPSDAGIAAEIILTTIAGRQVEAEKQIDEWEKKEPSSEEKKTWIRALVLRNKLNWKVVLHPESEPLLIRLQYVRSLIAQNMQYNATNFIQGDSTLSRIYSKHHAWD